MLSPQDAILTTMDIVHDGFGFMLAFGDLAWVPFLYCLQPRFLLESKFDLPWYCLAPIALLNGKHSACSARQPVFILCVGNQALAGVYSLSYQLFLSCVGNQALAKVHNLGCQPFLSCAGNQAFRLSVQSQLPALPILCG